MAWLWTGGALAACSVTNIENHIDPVDAALPDVTLPDVQTPEDAFPPDAVAPSPDAALPTDAGPGADTGARDAAAGDADAAVECAAPPVLHPPVDASIFCPFSSPAGQPPLRCPPTDECCEPPPDAGALSTCEAKGTACALPNSTRWECEATENCPAGEICCAIGADGGALGYNPAGTCGYPFLSSFDGTRCMNACPAGAMQVCESQAACAQGTCTALRARGAEVGLCK